MAQRTPPLGESGLQFFGKLASDNAHEIKNALAVINESAGLMEDLLAGVENGSAFAAGRLRSLAAKIKQQVARADRIAKSTNRFARSVTMSQGPVDLEQSLMLLTDLATRWAGMRQVRVELRPARSTVSVWAPPFVLLHLLWLCLQYAVQATLAGATIYVEVDRKDGAARIRYGPLSNPGNATLAQFSAMPDVEALLLMLNGRLSQTLDSAALVLALE